MTRPEIIRQDSIDLQEKTSPSAQDHTGQQALTSPTAIGAHQAEALREVAAETADQHTRSPRVSREWSSGEIQVPRDEDDLVSAVTAGLTETAESTQQDDLAVAQNGGLTGSAAEDADMADAEGDDGVDEDEDDMMDKISSSPSIDDGGYPLPLSWPQRSDSLARPNAPVCSSAMRDASSDSSSPIEEKSTHKPLRPLRDEVDKDVVPEVQNNNPPPEYHHLLGEYLDDSSEFEFDPESEGVLVPVTLPISTNTDNLSTEHYGEDDMSNMRNHSEEQHVETSEEHALESEPYSAILYEDYDDNMMTIPYEDSEDEDEDENEDDEYDISYPTDSRFIDSGWGGECLQELEDIDFEFVYALHTFVATVEGQANATKGDTMVLLDDSNSYWWLVRVVKDSSIGYLPAEHIETPTERLARLNKHRNIDLTSTMLGDQSEKPKNTLKKAILRRAAKNVTFAAPTYVEASDVDYSTDEEDAEGDYYGASGDQEKDGDEQEQEPEEETAKVEPLKIRSEARETSLDSTDTDGADAALKNSSDSTRTSDEVFEGQLESSRSKNGTVRNTDSFFKDDTVETRKITLTPNLLRDDSSTSPRTSVESSKEAKARPSLDKLLEKDSVDKKDKKNQKEKKEKDKKPGMLSGLFKRKDKKSRSQEDDGDEAQAAKDVLIETPGFEEISSPEEAAPEIQRQPSKLQKQMRTESPSHFKPSPTLSKETRTLEPLQIPTASQPTAVEAVQEPSMRLVQPDPSNEEVQESHDLAQEIDSQPIISSPPKESKASGAISKLLRSASNSDPKPIKTKKAKSRVELDDFDSSEEVSPIEESDKETASQDNPVAGSFSDSYSGTSHDKPHDTAERLSESPVEISPLTPTQPYPPPLMVDSSSQEDAPSPLSWPSPEPNEADDTREKKEADSSTTSNSTAAWSDTHLRTFFDDGSEIKDLLTVVYDKSNVVPAGPDHPLTGALFRAENAKLVDITNRLDGLLDDWLARKMRTQTSR